MNGINGSRRLGLRKMVLILTICMVLVSISVLESEALDNDVARTPPMGWNSWNAFHGDINEVLIKEITDAMVSSGMKDAGYEYVILDDNWMANPARDAEGNLIADPVRFPSGIKALADYIHSKGLKIGIYGDRGTMTCMNIPESGSYGYEERDAKTYAAWGVDYLKYDNCNSAARSCISCDYETMRDALANSGRPIVYGICAWGFQNWMPEVGNLWRTTGDIVDKWDNGNDWFVGIINAIDINQRYASYAKPGAWNDPDMLEIGNGGCTTEEYRTQFSMWSMMAAPLIAGNDLRNMTQETKDILLNTEVIAVNQDHLGIQCVKVRDDGNEEVYVKPLSNGDYAVALLNRGEREATISVTAEEIGFSTLDGYGYLVRDLWQHNQFGSLEAFDADVPVHGTAMFRVSQVPVDQLPGYLEISSTSNQIVSSEEAFEFSTILNNSGVRDVEDVTISLRLPDGWSAVPLSDYAFTTIAVGHLVTAKWLITPALAADGFNDIEVTVSYSDEIGETVWYKGTRLTVIPPAGSVYISALEPVISTNGWGPIEKDLSNGEMGAGDGRIITLNGVQYNKGLGVHAPSEVVFNIDGQFETFISDVGIDDEVGNRGSVTFEVWGDNVKLWESGIVEATTPTKTVNVSVKGVRNLKLVVTDGKDGNPYDHADWAGARLLPPLEN